MKAGDWLLVLILAVSIGLIMADGAVGGAISGWIDANLYPVARGIGSALGRISPWLLPVLALPLIAGIIGRFIGLSDPIDGVLRILIAVADSISTTIGDAARWLALGLVIVTATVVIQRYVFGFASTKLQESIIYMHALLFLLSVGSTMMADGHVRVDILYAKLSERGKAWTDMIGTYLALMPMALLILFVSTPYINASWRILERSRESDGLPIVFLLKTAIPVFALIVIIQGLAWAMRAALTLSGREAPGHAAPINNEL